MNTGTHTAAHPLPVAHFTQPFSSTVHPDSIEANQHLISSGTFPCCASGPSTSHIHTEEGDSSSVPHLILHHRRVSQVTVQKAPLDQLATQRVTLTAVLPLSQIGCLPNVQLTSKDNIDKNVETRSDYQTRSLHYFHTYAVRDRVDMSEFSNDVHIPDVSSINLKQLLPTP